MRNEDAGFEYSAGPDTEDENEHEMRRRIKREQVRLLRKKLCRFRFEAADEAGAGGGRSRRLKA